MPISDFQSQFSMSEIIQIFLKKFFIEEYQFRGIFAVIDISWKLQFLNHFVTKIMPIFQSPPAKRTLICQKIFLWKSAIFHTIKLPFDAEAAERILKVIYYLFHLGWINIEVIQYSKWKFEKKYAPKVPLCFGDGWRRLLQLVKNSLKSVLKCCQPWVLFQSYPVQTCRYSVKVIK